MTHLQIQEQDQLDELALNEAEAEFAREYEDAQKEVDKDLELYLETGLQYDPELKAWEEGMDEERQALIREKAKLSYLKKLEAREKAEKASRTLIGRLKAKVRRHASSIMLGAAVATTTVPVATVATVGAIKDAEEQELASFREATFLHAYNEDGVNNNLDLRVYGKILQVEDKIFNKKYKTKDEFQRAQEKSHECSGSSLLNYIVNNTFGFHDKQHPRYGFNINDLGKTMSLEQLERAMDVYVNIGNGKNNSSIYKGAKAEDVKTMRELILKGLFEPYIKDAANDGVLSPENKEIIGKLKKVMGKEYEAWLDNLLELTK